FIVMLLRQFILNFASVILGMPLKNVWLFPFGGSARVPRAQTRPLMETVLGLSGLFLNLIIAVIFQWLYFSASSGKETVYTVIVQWSAFFWYMLTIFHIFPGLPLEGGRLLQAGLWRTTQKYGLSVRVTGWLGRVFGLIFFLSGIMLLIFRTESVNGALLGILGWVLIIGANQSQRRALLLETLHDTRVHDVMSCEYPQIPPDLKLDVLVRDYLLITGHNFLTVCEGFKILGVITVKTLKRVPKKRWAETTAGDIMIPVKKVKTIDGLEPTANAIERMDQYRIDVLPVLENGLYAGVVIRDSLTRLAYVRGALKI
ncbi:MAG TPA: CBS domain-containing protein, partial [Dehalococcoidales bacterium]|nr:CBS domain-containing protein [Dehalococcoidales bacterium]